jgi:chromosomal replication initiator protein
MYNYAYDQPTITHHDNYWKRPVVLHKALTIDDIIDAACTAFNVNRSELLSKCKKKELVRARQKCMYVIKMKLEVSLEFIAEKFNKNDHTSVHHAIRVVKRELATKHYKDQTTEEIDSIIELL